MAWEGLKGTATREVSVFITLDLGVGRCQPHAWTETAAILFLVATHDPRAPCWTIGPLAAVREGRLLRLTLSISACPPLGHLSPFLREISLVGGARKENTQA